LDELSEILKDIEKLFDRIRDISLDYYTDLVILEDICKQITALKIREIVLKTQERNEKENT
jgi:hypothetical protein